MNRPGDSLPRPATPGPWHADGPVSGFDHTWTVWATRGTDDDPCDDLLARMAHVRLDAVQEADARAIAALPMWIAAHDAERARADEATARAERAEAALAEVWGDARAGVTDRADTFGEGVRAQALDTLAILRRHGYGEAP